MTQSWMRILSCCLLAVVGTPLAAQLTPLGGELQVNTFTHYEQSRPGVAADSSGNFVVVWQSQSYYPAYEDIRAQRYDSAGGTVGAEFAVNTHTPYAQIAPSVAGGDAGFVVTWQSYDQDGSGYGIFAQRYTSTGTLVGGEFQVNTHTDADQRRPRAAADSSGSFTVVWYDDTQDGDGSGVFGQRFAVSGARQGAEFQVNTTTNSSQDYPTVAMDPAGSVFVAWQADDDDGRGVFAQLFDSAGLPRGGEFQVNSHTAGDQQRPAVASGPGGEFVVAWQSYDQDGYGDGVFAQVFASSGAPLGGEFAVNSYTSSFVQGYPAVAVDAAGSFVVSWESYEQDGSSYPAQDGIFAQLFDSAGLSLGGEFQVNVYTNSDQDQPSVIATGTGSFVVAWRGVNQDGCPGEGGRGVFGQRFDSAGIALGSEFRVNTYTLFGQRDPVVGVAPDGSFVASWHSQQDGSSSGIFAQRYDSNGAAAGAEFQVNTFTDGRQRYATLGVDGNGGFVVGWEGEGTDEEEIFAQRYDSSGIAAGTEFRVNTHFDDAQRYPSVAVAANGDFVVAWQSQDQDGSNYGVFAQRYSSTGSPIGGEFQVNTFTGNRQMLPQAAIEAGGSFVVTWQSRTQDGSSDGVFAQRFDSSGAPAGGELQVNVSTAQAQDQPSVGSSANGDFVVGWHHASPDDVRLRRFDSSGTPLSGEIGVGSIENPSVSVAGDGRFVVAWEDTDGANRGIFGQLFDSAGGTLGAEFQVNTFTSFRQRAPSVGTDANGNFVVIWESPGQESCHPGSDGGVFVRRLADTTGTTCPSTPAPTCDSPAKGRLIVSDHATDDSKNKLIWLFKQGTAITQADFGDPTSTTAYAFCVYDDDTLVVDTQIPAGMLWSPVGTAGYLYKDKTAANDGMFKVRMTGPGARGSKLKVKAKGVNLPLPGPVGMTYFGATTDVRVQLHGNGRCWDTTFGTAQILRNAPNIVKAKF